VNGSEYVQKRVKKEYIGKRDTGDSRAKPLRDLAGSKTNTSFLIPHGVQSTVSLETMRNQEGELVFKKKTMEHAQRLKESGADELVVEENTPPRTQKNGWRADNTCQASPITAPREARVCGRGVEERG